MTIEVVIIGAGEEQRASPPDQRTARRLYRDWLATMWRRRGCSLEMRINGAPVCTFHHEHRISPNQRRQAARAR